MKIVVAYSGGLDTSILLTWLKEQYNADIIAFCADIGQEEELDGLDKKVREKIYFNIRKAQILRPGNTRTDKENRKNTKDRYRKSRTNQITILRTKAITHANQKTQIGFSRYHDG